MRTPEPGVAEIYTLLRAAIEKSLPVYIGIDPGAHGAIGFVAGSGQLAESIHIPTVKVETRRTRRDKETGKNRSVDGSTTRFDLAGIHEIFSVIKDAELELVSCKVMLEAVPPTLGPGRRYAEIMLNRAYAMWPLYLHSLALRTEEARPVDWKKAMGLTGKEKDASRLLAQKLFPSVRLARKSDSDRAEALLLADYARRIESKIEKADPLLETLDD